MELDDEDEDEDAVCLRSVRTTKAFPSSWLGMKNRLYCGYTVSKLQKLMNGWKCFEFLRIDDEPGSSSEKKR